MTSPVPIDPPPLAYEAGGSLSPESPRLQTPRTPPFTPSTAVAKYRRTSSSVSGLSLSPLQLHRRRSSSGHSLPFPYDEDPPANNLPLPPGAAPAIVAPFSLLEGASVLTEEPLIDGASIERPPLPPPVAGSASTSSRPTSSVMEDDPPTPTSTVSSSSGSRIGAAVRRGLDRRRSSARQSLAEDGEGSPARHSLRSLSFLRPRSMSFSTTFDNASREEAPQPPPKLELDRDGRVPPTSPPISGKSFSVRNRKQRSPCCDKLPLPPPRGVVLAAGVQSTAVAAVADELVWGTLSYRALPEPDLFGSMLPRELQVKIFRSLLDSWIANPGPGKWDGEMGGLRELVRLSRVSSEWRSLCFDGTLWANADMTPLAGVLHRNTLRQIISHARPCVKNLSLRGLDGVSGLDLKPRLGSASPLSPRNWTSLTRLDVRGAQNLTIADLCDLIHASPRLTVLILKGWRHEVRPALSALLAEGTALEELDVSRCQGMEFGAIEEYLGSLSQRQSGALRSLRISGLADASGQSLFKRLAQLPNLTTLDLLGCRWLSEADIQEYVDSLPAGTSPLQHLVLSSCTNLTTGAIELLIGKLPEMRIFEAASLEPVFYMDPPPLLPQLVRSMPLLTHLDLDETGRYGAVNNAVLYELVPGSTPQSPLLTSSLRELRIGSAKDVSASCLVTLIRELPGLRVLAADGTKADARVLREFMRVHPHGGHLSLVDCHRLTSESYAEVSDLVRCRAGDSDLSSTPFEYVGVELQGHRTVVKSFWGWRKTTIPMFWRQARDLGEMKRSLVGREREDRGRGGSGGYRWWTGTEDLDELERGACSVM